MTTFDAHGRRHLRSIDTVAAAGERAARLRQLGLGTMPDAEFDAIAAQLAQATGAPATMVNFIDDKMQNFSGLFMHPSMVVAGTAVGPGAASSDDNRHMSVEEGWCPHVVVRRRAFPLDDVFAYPRFAGDRAVDKLGVRAYLGAPLIDRTGVALGTVCAVDQIVHPWGHEGVQIIKEFASEVVAMIHRRERRQ
jgi:GAF domain-containing protein